MPQQPAAGTRNHVSNDRSDVYPLYQRYEHRLRPRPSAEACSQPPKMWQLSRQPSEELSCQPRVIGCPGWHHSASAMSPGVSHLQAGRQAGREPASQASTETGSILTSMRRLTIAGSSCTTAKCSGVYPVRGLNRSTSAPQPDLLSNAVTIAESPLAVATWIAGPPCKSGSSPAGMKSTSALVCRGDLLSQAVFTTSEALGAPVVVLHRSSSFCASPARTTANTACPSWT